ncbi:CRISPR-associated helicase Cas3' [Megasphaera sueciensis]|uniref:CRISPR-associated helicase Cas3' n=1 Tax=Megasphaera sueciensis TaxID=349094 RepID=UPI003D07926D
MDCYNDARLMDTLWGKIKSNNQWLPLVIHLKDTAAVMKLLYDKWLSGHAKYELSRLTNLSEVNLTKLLRFLGLAHDLGKATPGFQFRTDVVFSNQDLGERLIDIGLINTYPNAYNEVKHARAGEVLLTNFGCNAGVASIIGAHHGLATDDAKSEEINTYPKYYGAKIVQWTKVQAQLCTIALELGGYRLTAEIPLISKSAQVVLCGLLIMADWIASNETFFPLIDWEQGVDNIDEEYRIISGWHKFKLTGHWQSKNLNNLYKDRFGFTPNLMQQTVESIVKEIKSPGLLIIEAEMGQGKTEAALVAAEYFANKTNCDGVYFALPTQATSNSMFIRLKGWVDYLNDGFGHSVNLAHGNAWLNDDFTTLSHVGSKNGMIYDEDDNLKKHTSSCAEINDWFTGRKQGLLADFVVGTVDQLLMMSHISKHIFLRHLAFLNKIVIVDECHAYDAYTDEYLKTTLRWLGAYQIPVILLSATLTKSLRKTLAEEYAKGAGNIELTESILSLAYPLITYTDILNDRVNFYNVTVRNERVKNIDIKFVEGEITDNLNLVEKLYYEGGYIGIVVNTVNKAQQLYKMAKEKFGSDNVELFHSRFLAADRSKRESALIKQIGKSNKNHGKVHKVIIGTQVLEQSLDIDFDVLITEICPIDLFFQRIGRLFRHADVIRPTHKQQPLCYIMGVNSQGKVEDKGSLHVYDQYILERTYELLHIRPKVTLPDDIPSLIDAVYETQDFNAENEGLWKLWQEKIENKENKSRGYMIESPKKLNKLNKTLIGFTKNSDSGNDDTGVRDSTLSQEIILLQEKNKYIYYFEGEQVPEEQTAQRDKQIASQAVGLPLILINDTVLESIKETTVRCGYLFNNSPVLKYALVMLVDEKGQAEFGDYIVSYSKEEGLTYERQRI